MNRSAAHPVCYLDHAATTPLRDCAAQEWWKHRAEGNPGGQYASGRRARAALEDARESVAELLGADPAEVVFTASGTEADNIAVRGLFEISPACRVVASPVEHPAVRKIVEDLAARDGAEVSWLPVERNGHVSAAAAEELLHPDVALFTCMYANNETGAVQPVGRLAAIAREAGVAFHVDAVQAVGHLPLNFHELGATTLAASAHKFGGPRGMGILLAQRSPAPHPVIMGGGQERGLRSGTVDVAGACATAAALREASESLESERARLRALRDTLARGISHSIDNVHIHTHEPALESHLSVCFPGAEGDSLLMLLDAAGIEAATGSACHAGVNRASDVLLAMGVNEADARGALRFTLGYTTTAADVERVLEVLPRIVAQARAAGMA